VLGRRIHNDGIVRWLGECGMGSVDAAEHRVIRRRVAINVLKAELAYDVPSSCNVLRTKRARLAGSDIPISWKSSMWIRPDDIPGDGVIAEGGSVRAMRLHDATASVATEQAAAAWPSR
jgi:hypothetical protein